MNEYDKITMKDLHNYTMKGLLKLAKELDIKGRHDMRKDDLIASIYTSIGKIFETEKQLEQDTTENQIGADNKAIANGSDKQKPVEEENEDKVEIVFRSHSSRKTRQDYINNVQKNQIIAFAMTDEKAFSAKVTEVFQNAKKELNYVLCETRNGNKFKVPASRILWIKTRDKWPDPIMDMLKNNTKIDDLND